MTWSLQKPPSARQIYLCAFAIACLVTLIMAYHSGLFHKETHPDPTLGNIGLLMTIFTSIASFFFVAALLVISRWFFWPTARTTIWNVQAAIYGTGVLWFVGSMLLTGYFVSKEFLKEKNNWAIVENSPLPEGVQEAYFPARSERFETKVSEATRFREFAIEGTTAYQREGWANLGYGQVSMRKFGSAPVAEEALLAKKQEAEREGYHSVSNIQF